MSKPKTWTHIHFDLNDVDIDYMRQLRSDLMDEGVYFDYGVGIHGTATKKWRTLEWQTDSKHPHMESQSPSPHELA